MEQKAITLAEQVVDLESENREKQEIIERFLESEHRDQLEIMALKAERDGLAAALWSAEDQWGDDYLWKKWGLSKTLTQERKDALSTKLPLQR